VFLRALTRSIARRPKRFGVAVVAVALGVAMATALASVSLVLGDRLGRTVRQYGANLVLVPKGADVPLEVAGTDVSALLAGGAIPESTLVTLTTFRWRNNILGFAPQSYAAGTVAATRMPEPPPTSSSLAILPAARVAVVGTWFQRMPAGSTGTPRPAGMSTIAPWWKIEGSAPTESADDGPPQALVGRALAKRLDARRGDHLTLALEGAAGGTARDLAVSGILDAGGLEDDQLFVPLEWLQLESGRPGSVDKVLVSALVLPGEAPPMPDPAKDLAAYERWVCRPFAASVGYEIEQSMPGVTARPIASLVRGEGRLVGRLNLLMLLLTGAAITAAALGVMSTMVASVVDRTQEIALLRALGATTPSVGRLFLAEALVVAAVGGLLGVGLGFALAQVVGRGAFGTAVEPHPLLVPAGLALAAGVCLLGAWLPLRRAAAIDPARALKAGA